MNEQILEKFRQLSPEQQELLIFLILKMLVDYQSVASVLR